MEDNIMSLESTLVTAIMTVPDFAIEEASEVQYISYVRIDSKFEKIIVRGENNIAYYVDLVRFIKKYYPENEKYLKDIYNERSKLRYKELGIKELFVEHMKKHLTDRIGETATSKMNGDIYKFCGELTYDLDALIKDKVDRLVSELNG